MKRFTWVIFVIALIIVGIETFRPQPHFPGADSGPGNDKAASSQTPSITQGNL